MTLKEKLNEQLSEAFANEIEKLTDEFAIGFLKFANKNYIYRKGHYHMKGDFEKSININQQQLLEIYKKQKGL
jgi:hypothetical protein